MKKIIGVRLGSYYKGQKPSEFFTFFIHFSLKNRKK